MSFTLVTHKQQWDSSLVSLPQPHTLQSWDWGDFKSRWGWQPHRLLWLGRNGLGKDEQPIAAAQVLKRPIPYTSWGMLYVPKGPLLNYDDLPVKEQIVRDLAAFARSQRALFIKIDPDVILGFDPAADTPNPSGQAVKAMLQDRGWLYSAQQIQFQNTVLLNLDSGEDTLLAGMKSKWRYNIRLAQRKGVLIQAGTEADLDTFYALYALTGQRDGFLIRPQAYYLDLWQHYLLANQADLLLAYVQDKPIAGLMLFYFGQRAWYMYGASSNEHRNLMPNHLLQWRAIQQAQARGCRVYDMWGAPTVFDSSDPLWGVYKFKLGFGGYTRQGLGAYDYPVWSGGYRFYHYVWPKILAALKSGLTSSS